MYCARTFSWDDAARLLGTTKPALLALMRQGRKMRAGSTTLPTDDLVKAGYFTIEQRQVVIDNGSAKNYYVARTTIQGLAWLQRELTQSSAA